MSVKGLLMKISSINYSNIKTIYKQKSFFNKYLTPQKNDTFSFCGSIYKRDFSAIETIETVKSRKGIVPERVERLAAEWSSDEKTKKLPLINAHKQAYSKLAYCKTLDEAKELYPEFRDVKSINDINPQRGSTLYCLANGLVTGFEPEDDVSLKLLKYYWCDLISTRDLPGIAKHKLS